MKMSEIMFIWPRETWSISAHTKHGEVVTRSGGGGLLS